MQAWTRPVLALAFLATTGCAGGAGLGAIGDILGGMAGLPGAGGGGNEIRGQVSYVDERRSEIELQSDQGQRARLSFDSRTEVVYQNQRYPVTALEAGDRVAVRVQQSQGGALYAQQILVEQSVSEGGGGGGAVGSSGRVDRFDGQVGWIDQPRGRFELRTSRGSYTVTMPYNPNPTVADRFRRLRGGDTVRIEGEFMGSDRIELLRFF